MWPVYAVISIVFIWAFYPEMKQTYKMCCTRHGPYTEVPV